MPRTADRPLASGRISMREAWWFGAVSGLAGIAYLSLTTPLITMLFGALCWILYVVVYTPMKLVTPLNTVVGAVAGALPALIGWTAVGAPLDLAGATLFLIVFLWQFPHFMAIAWLYRKQYALAGMRMLPVVDPSGNRAGRQAVVAALALLPVSLLPAMVSFAGPTYFAWTLLLGIVQLVGAVLFMIHRDDRSARRLLRMSLVYLPAVMLLLMLGPFLS